jgi:RNA polymerase sigma-70 factor (ECF subfamily)
MSGARRAAHEGRNVRDLVERASRGDRDAFDALASASVDRLYAIAHRILRDTDRAEDAVQSALLEAWRDLPRLRETDKFDAWMRRLLVHACYDEAKRQRAYRATLTVVPIEPSTSDRTDDLADRDELERAFRRLSPEQRMVVVLFHYADLPLAEVASTLGISVGTVKSRLHYAMRGLRAAVEADSRAAEAMERPA